MSTAWSSPYSSCCARGGWGCVSVSPRANLRHPPCSLCPEATQEKVHKGTGVASVKESISHPRGQGSFHKNGPGVGLLGEG